MDFTLNSLVSQSEADGRPLFTVLTPTFNRGDLLLRPYRSLLAQNERRFEWLIVDDGSTDETAEIVRNWQAEATFPIRYVYQENQHKKVALNAGFRLARGEYTIVLDSDDELTPDGLAIFANAWDGIPAEQRHRFSSIRALCADENGELVGDAFPEDPFQATPNELLYRYRIGGEKLSADRTDILRQFPFPEDIKGYVPEQVLWSQLSENYECRCINSVVRVYHTSTESISRRLERSNFHGDLEGLAYAYNFVLDHDARWFFSNPTVFIKAAANRKRFMLHLDHLGNSRELKIRNTAAMAIDMFFGWIGRILYFRDLNKSRSGRS